MISFASSSRTPKYPAPEIDDQRAIEGADLGIMVGLIGPALGPCGETYFLIQKLAGRYPEAADGDSESEEPRSTHSSEGRDRTFSD